MFEYSNNFTANQIALTMGAQVYGPPATLDKAVRAVKEAVSSVCGFRDAEIAEGSGISRENRISARRMLEVLKHFAPYRHLLMERGPARYKTGTLRGIRTRAGYIETTPGRPYPFVIFLGSADGRIDSYIDCMVRRLARAGGK